MCMSKEMEENVLKTDEDFHEDLDKNFLEFEGKYTSDIAMLPVFKDLMESSPEVKDFLYVEGEDIYYSKGDEFLRHRLPTKISPRSELTHKKKPEGASNNIARTEVDVRVDKNDVVTIKKFCDVLGFKHYFRITKYCHIYYTAESTLVFYSIKDHEGGKGTRDHFVEIEVDKKLAANITRNECKAIIRRWENFLAPIGIKYQKRLDRQLFDIYRKF